MAQSLPVAKTTSHARSVSVPAVPHPLASNVEDHLKRLKTASGPTSSSSTTEIVRNLCVLKDLFESVNDFLQLPKNHQDISNGQHGQSAEEVLDRSLKMLDVFGTTRDLLVNIQELVQQLQSSLRRQTGNFSLMAEVAGFIKSRNTINKMVSKCILDLKALDKRCFPELSDRCFAPTISMLREAEAVTIVVLNSLLNYVSATKATPKRSGWKLVPKFAQSKRTASDLEEEANGNEVENMDGALYALVTLQKSTKDASTAILVQKVLKQLSAVDVALHDLEEGLEPIFRQLLETRVCILNARSQ